MNRQDLAMKLFVNNGWSPTEAFTLADMFIAECESQKREPKACEHKRTLSWSQVPPLTLFCQDCGTVIPAPVSECEHEWRQPPYMFNQICHKCGELKPDPPKPDVCEYCGDTFKEGDGHSRTTIGPMPVLSCPKHPTNQPSFTMKQPEPPKPERVAREWWIRYPLLTPNGACVPEVWPDTDKHANIFEGDKWIKVREIMPGEER